MAEVWSEVLGIDHVGVSDNFFDLGGDSLLTMQVVARAKQSNLYLTPRQLFENQNIGELARVTTRGQTVVAEEKVTGPVPLTPIQQWFFELELLDRNYFASARLFELREPIDPRRLAAAVRAVITHHDMLRTRFIPGTEAWSQEILENVEVHVSSIDLSAVEDPQKTLQISAPEMAADLDLLDGNLVRVVLFDLGPRHPQCMAVFVHHLVMDVVSWGPLLEDLTTAYRELEKTDKVSLPSKTTSFKHWAERLTSYVAEGGLDDEFDFWLSEGGQEVSRLPLDDPGAYNSWASARSIQVELDEEASRAILFELPPALGCRPNEVLLTALARSVAAWSGHPKLRIHLEGHGREDLFDDVDLSRTIGWFTSIFPVVLETSPETGSLEALRMVQERIRRVPHRGIGYGLLRYFSRDHRATVLRSHYPPEVNFNYVGQSDHLRSSEALIAKSRPILEMPVGRTSDGRRPYQFNITAGVRNERLYFVWIYSEALHERSRVEIFVAEFLSALRSLSGLVGFENVPRA